MTDRFKEVKDRVMSMYFNPNKNIVDYEARSYIIKLATESEQLRKERDDYKDAYNRVLEEKMRRLKMEMPDKIYAVFDKKIKGNIGIWDDDSSCGQLYHHDRILKAKDAEIAELKAYIEARGYDAI
jgi:hypothetical protein